ncbi:hypothetical protein TTHERM_000437779 (macronuclear) [Tetrahymena thermophila SB210]|uniref:Uncharacterized protein n=1 Tax=Tetrahymena thermophila (strain SB210) TaxID=312017 RepID=W7XJ94_TETTS|nr:hypothetical protein TTHERM_000437779 [Tetrahymena thermophila SB210]EWS73969.1 hypothetical protein TTHERM_000437779 [Tetrahymena thermophila SB210]|eukprot:XP_012653510.1 hypothetical protein TTHERM_000437779 [Tetrahymena thermophila SB210]
MICIINICFQLIFTCSFNIQLNFKGRISFELIYESSRYLIFVIKKLYPWNKREDQQQFFYLFVCLVGDLIANQRINTTLVNQLLSKRQPIKEKENINLKQHNNLAFIFQNLVQTI